MLSFFRRKSDLRPLENITSQPTPATLEELHESAFYAEAVAYFTDYPTRSLMSDHSRATLYSIIKVRRPTYIAEIGTFRAGTTEVMARACWETTGAASTRRTLLAPSGVLRSSPPGPRIFANTSGSIPCRRWTCSPTWTNGESRWT